MGAVYRKELRSSFTGMTGALFIAVVVCVISVVTYIFNLNYGYGNFEFALISGSFWSLLIVPILTMKLFSEERHSKTDQLLYSLPLTGTQVVLGKYFAMVTVFAVPCALFCLYPVIISMFYDGKMPFMTSYAGILTYFLLGCAVIAICMFISSLSESQLITAIVSIVVLVLLYVIGSTASSLTGVLGAVVSSVCFFQKMYDASHGYVDVPCLIYYLSAAVLFVFFTVQSFEKRRWS